MRKLLIVILLGSILTFTASSQQNQVARTTSSQSVFLELGGNALIVSMNYDRRFSGHNSGIGGRAGIGFVPGIGHGSRSATMIPVGINHLLGKGPHHLETGAGATFVIQNHYGDDEASVYFVPSAGYRYQPLNKGASIRLFASPFVSSNVFRFWAGLSIGLSF